MTTYLGDGMQTIKPVNFVYNKPLKFRKRRGEDSGENEKKRYTTNSKRLITGNRIIDKNIQTYKMWFLFLKLALELEEQGAVLIMKRSTEKGSKQKVKVKHRVKVNRKKYEGWDLDDVLKMHFNTWWPSHNHLFSDEGIKVLEEGDVVKDEDGYLYVKINMNRRICDIKGQLTWHIEKTLSNKSKRHKTQAKFPVSGNPRPLVLQNRYNALLLKLEDELSDKEILNFKNKYLRASDGRIPKGYTTEHASRAMFGLISGNKRVFGAKQILLSVCDGYFVKHPTKTYID